MDEHNRQTKSKNVQSSHRLKTKEEEEEGEKEEEERTEGENNEPKLL